MSDVSRYGPLSRKEKEQHCCTCQLKVHCDDWQEKPEKRCLHSRGTAEKKLAKLRSGPVPKSCTLSDALQLFAELKLEFWNYDANRDVGVGGSDYAAAPVRCTRAALKIQGKTYSISAKL